ncbi:MAG: hypothetical protein M3Y87_07385 [Myxococcota bacterium]|nr:hypothetical protein [Myxococcota bacterium]
MRNNPGRASAPLLALVLVVGCGGAHVDADAGTADGSARDGDASDDATRPDDAMPHDDARIDPSSCGAREGLPSWIAAADVAHHLIARGDGRDVHVWLFDDGLARVRYVAPGSTRSSAPSRSSRRSRR